eukprot:2603325-Pyramimonas_sp.AAC.1
MNPQSKFPLHRSLQESRQPSGHSRWEGVPSPTPPKGLDGGGDGGRRAPKMAPRGPPILQDGRRDAQDSRRWLKMVCNYRSKMVPSAQGAPS